MKCEIIAIGSEMLTPYRQDTNSLYFTEKLNGIGVTIAYKTIVGDRQKEIVNALQTALGRVDIVVVMGGLGPTVDDLTREAVAQALSISLRRDAAVLAALHARAAERRVPMPENNQKQADLLDGAILLNNPNGSAPGQWLDVTFSGYRKLLILLPGPPRECKPLFDTECLPRLKSIVPVQHIAQRTLKAAMIPESYADQLLAPIYTTYKDVETTILAHAGDIQLTLSCQKPTMAQAQARVNELSTRLEEALEDWLYSNEGDSLEQIVLYCLGVRQTTLSVAESVTGGMIAERLTSVPDSSRVFLGGAVVYSDQLKTQFANVAPELIAQYGNVSAEVSASLAQGIRRQTGSVLGLGVTGIAGPSGGTPEKPVGLVFISIADGKTTDTIERRFSGDRERVRQLATQQALDLIRRRVM